MGAVHLGSIDYTILLIYFLFVLGIGWALSQSQGFFIVRARDNMQFRPLYSHPVDRSIGLRCDQTIVLTGKFTPRYYPEKLRRIHYVDSKREQSIIALTNNFVLPALVAAQLYKCRWRIEQHLRIKAFYGTSENAVKTQISYFRIRLRISMSCFMTS
jgi:IS4 transposase